MELAHLARSAVSGAAALVSEVSGAADAAEAGHYGFAEKQSLVADLSVEGSLAEPVWESFASSGHLAAAWAVGSALARETVALVVDQIRLLDIQAGHPAAAAVAEPVPGCLELAGSQVVASGLHADRLTPD